MRVDEFDNTLVNEERDVEMTFEYFRRYREVPIYIESEILNYILEVLKIDYSNDYSIEEKLNKLPRDQLKEFVSLINGKFSENISIVYDNFHLPYLMYYLPINIYKVWKPLIDLHTKNLLKPSLQILDIGTGPGSIPIGIIEFYKELALNNANINFSLYFSLIEKEIDFIKIATKMICSTSYYMPSNLKIEILSICNETVSESYTNNELKTYDLITMSNFLAINELDNNQVGYKIVSKFKNNLNKDGSIIIIDPGDEANCYSLKRIRNKLVNEGGFTLFSPCNRIWEENNNYSCNCFNSTKSFWDVPRIFMYLAKNGLSKNLRADVPFIYLVLRIDHLKKYNIIRNQQHYSKLIDIRDKIGQIITTVCMIRVVVYHKSAVSISLCDGTCDFGIKGNQIWLDIPLDLLKEKNSEIPIIAAERIILRKVLVTENNKTIKLFLTEESKIKIEF